MSRTRLTKQLHHIPLILITLVMFFPLYIVFVMGTYYSEHIFDGLPIFFGNYFFENLKTVIANDYLLAFKNSVYISAVSMFFSVLISAMIGFSLAKYHFKGKNLVFILILAMMMIPGQITLIGYMLEMKAFGFLNTLLPMICVWLAHPLGAFLMAQFIKDAVADELLESGRLDGCSEPRLFFIIVIPSIKPGLLTLVTLVFLWSWNNYMLPLVILHKQELFPIPLMISFLSNQFRSDYGAIMCGLTLSILPVIIIFSLSSRTFIAGIASGAVKG